MLVDGSQEITIGVSGNGNGNGDDGVSAKLTLKAPAFALVGKAIKVSGTTEGASQTVYIMLQKEAWNIDWLSQDEKLAEIRSDSKGNFEAEIELETLGFNKIYAGQKEEWLGLDWLKSDIKSPTQNILTLNYFLILGIGLAVFLLLWKHKVIQKVIGGK